MIQIMKLNGTDKQLYKLVAPLVMDPEVLKMNNNYPFKTTDKFVWFVAVSGKKVVGFIPIEQRGNVAIINNYYIDKDQEEAFSFIPPHLYIAFPNFLNSESLFLKRLLVLGLNNSRKGLFTGKSRNHIDK